VHQGSSTAPVQRREYNLQHAEMEEEEDEEDEEEEEEEEVEEVDRAVEAEVEVVVMLVDGFTSGERV